MSKVHIYLFDDMRGLDTAFAENNLLRLPAFRQERCAKYRQSFDKNTCTIAYLLLAKGLREQYHITRPAEFTYNEHGKPFLRDTPHIYFNFSHCKRGVVCALADFEVGIDIQEIRLYEPDIARRVCSENELRQLLESDNPAQQFCRIWTRKEAHAKAKGIGVASVLKCDLTDARIAEWVGIEYCMALSAKENAIMLDAEVTTVGINDVDK